MGPRSPFPIDPGRYIRLRQPDAPRAGGTAVEVLLVFLKLGLGSFGGPVAHLGYFRAELVERRRWLDEADYAELVGLCQVLPGPASSQTGFALGLLRAGFGGGIAAFVGFTLPSAVLMGAFATVAGSVSASSPDAGLLHGLKLAAIAVVAQAVWAMARTLCPDRPRAGLALIAAAVSTAVPASLGQLAAIATGALGGALVGTSAGWGRGAAATPRALAFRVTPRIGAACLLAFAVLLAFSIRPPAGAKVFAAFFRSGALVFGGGHVVLPLLHDAVVRPGWVSESTFLAGYGAAQAMPGPLFTFAAFLGASLQPDGGAAGAIVPLLAIFLPGFLLLVGMLPFWERWLCRRAAPAAIRGINVAVVGLLACALFRLLRDGTVRTPSDAVLVLLGGAALIAGRAPPIVVVAVFAAAGLAGASLG